MRVSNSAGAKASREQEIAFLIMEDVLGVDIHLADTGAGNKKLDGSWATRIRMDGAASWRSLRLHH